MNALGEDLPDELVGMLGREGTFLDALAGKFTKHDL